MIIKLYGKKKWAIAGGYISVKGTGKEPAFVSHNKLSILNTTNDEAQVKIIIYFEGEEPAGEYKIKLKPERVRKLRINDLIDPRAIPLGIPFSCIIESDIPVIVQFTRQDTGHQQLALMGTMAFGSEGIVDEG